MESSIKFATVINEQMISTGKSGIKGIYLVWNMVDGREKTELYKAYDKVCAEFALSILETHLPDSKRFRKETAAERKAVFRSTAFPATKYWYAAATSTNSSMRFSASSKTEWHGKENKNRGHRQRSRNHSFPTGRYKHSAGSEKHGRKTLLLHLRKKRYRKPFLHLPRTPKRSRNAGAGTASRKNWIMTPYSYGGSNVNGKTSASRSISARSTTTAYRRCFM